MQTAPIFKLNLAGLLLFSLTACGSPQTPSSPATPSASTTDSDASATTFTGTDAVASDAGASSFDASAPITTTSTTSSDSSAATDPCAKPSADFEQLVRPKFNACYQEGKKKNPNLTGEIRVTLSFDYKGKITSIKPTSNDDLGKPVIACMVDAVKKTTFPNPDACPRKSIMVGKKFGEPAKGTITAD
jgi:hypothetical protein